MPDFLLELLTEEIPARMQAAAADQLRVRFGDGIRGKLPGGDVETFVTPRRLILFARGLGAEGNAVEEERRGPRADAPAQALEGFLRSTGLSRDSLEERDTPKGRFFYATIRTPGRTAAQVIAELVPQIVRDFDWPKSMRWGEASVSTASPRWVRPLSSIVALLDGEVVAFEAAGVASGRTTRGHRFMARGALEIASAVSYADQLRAAKVLIDPAERQSIIAEGARAAAAAHGLALIEDPGLVAENAGLTEWPVPLLGEFDPAFLDVPREVIQLTMRTNQKYFACVDGQGALAPAFVCVANLEAPDGGATIVAGNRKVLAARLADAKFFWDADRAVTLESRLPKLRDIVFHEKLGTVADKVERVAKLARWLVESGAVFAPFPEREGSGMGLARTPSADFAEVPPPTPPVPGGGPSLADLAEQAARLCKADLVSATVGEFPEVQGIAGRYLALAEGLDPQVADAIRDHYKPVGQGDDVPTAPVSVAVALADKLDTLLQFFIIDEKPTGSRDPFALRRAALSIAGVITLNDIRLSMYDATAFLIRNRTLDLKANIGDFFYRLALRVRDWATWLAIKKLSPEGASMLDAIKPQIDPDETEAAGLAIVYNAVPGGTDGLMNRCIDAVAFIIDRLKVQQREAGIRPDIIDAVFALGGEDDLVRLLARVRACQAFIDTDDGANLLAGYRRAANILRIEETKDGPHAGSPDPALLADPAERALAAALDTALPAAADAVAREAFEDAMTALSRLRSPVDAFFDAVMVNDPEPEIRSNRLKLLASFRAAVHTVADFSRIV